MTGLNFNNRWESRRLATLFTENTNKNALLSSTNALQFRYGEIHPKPVYKLTDDLKETYRKYTLVRPNDIMLNGLNLNYDFVTQRVAQVKVDGIITSVYISLRPREGVSTQYYTYLFKSLDAMKVFNGMGTGIRLTLSFNLLKNIKLPVPPRAEQDQIVRCLDWQVSTINKLIAAKKKEITKIDNLKEKILAEVISLGLNYFGEYISDEYWIEKYPAEWENIKLRRILSVPMTDGPHETPLFVDEGIPFISAEASHHGKIHLSQCRGYITKEMHELYCQKIKPQRNDVFVVKSGSTTGKTVIVDFDDEFSVWSPLALIRCNNRAIPKYIFYFCTSRYFQQQVHDNWSFGTQPNIGMSELEKLRVILPSIEEQHLIVSFLDEKFGQIDVLTYTLEKQINTLHELRTRIISDVVTGQIDVRSIEVPDFEMVEEIDESDGEDGVPEESQETEEQEE